MFLAAEGRSGILQLNRIPAAVNDDIRELRIGVTAQLCYSVEEADAARLLAKKGFLEGKMEFALREAFPATTKEAHLTTFRQSNRWTRRPLKLAEVPFDLIVISRTSIASRTVIQTLWPGANMYIRPCPGFPHPFDPT